MKLHSLTCCSHPAVQPGSKQATDQYLSMARGLGTPDLEDAMDQAGEPGVGGRERKSKYHSTEREYKNISNKVYYFKDLLAEP